MSENKKKVAAATTEKAVKEKEEGKKKISEKNLAIIITAAVLAVVIIVAAVISIVNAIQKDVGFNYLKSDLSKYIEFTEDYKDFEINVDIAKPKDIDVDVAILSLLCKEKSEKPLHGGGIVTSPMVIGPGDIVHIWYRGYLIGENGEEIDVSGMSNFGGSVAELEIGSGGFIPGFELGLVGKNTGDAAKFEKITMGKPTESQVAYISYTKLNEKTAEKTTASNERVELSGDVDAKYGTGFKEKLMLGVIGNSFDFSTETSDGNKYKYTNVKIEFVTEFENKPIVVETYFPYDYQKADLRNETAIFEVYVDGVVDYEAPEFTDEFIEKQIEEKAIGITKDQLNEYEGATLVEKYRDFAKKAVDEIYEEEYKELVESAIWEHYQSIVKVKKYPPIKVDAIFDEYVSNLQNQFNQNGGQIYNSYTGSYNTYSTLDTYAVAYYGLSTGADWRDYVYGLAETLVKERMIMYYIVRAENLVPSDEEFKKLVDLTKADYLSEYVEQYLSYEGKTREDYTDEEYADFLEERAGEILGYYDDTHFEETTYYNIVVDNFIDWPTVKTFDDRRAYPVTK